MGIQNGACSGQRLPASPCPITAIPCGPSEPSLALPPSAQKLACEVANAFHELTGLSLELTTLGHGKQGRPERRSALCPAAEQHQRNGTPLSPQCDQCVRQRWLSRGGERLVRGEYRGPCGCLWAEMELCGNQQVVMLVRGAHRNLEEPIAGVLRLIIHQLQSGFEAASAQSALKRAEHRIRSLEQALGLKQTSVLAPAPPPSKRHLAEAMRKFAEGNWQRPIQLRDVASALNMNPSYLCGLFSQCTGTTFHAYLETLRLTKARELLRDPARRVQEVAFSVGFSSGAHFCRVFKVRNGLSPRAWRAMHTSGVTGAAE